MKGSIHNHFNTRNKSIDSTSRSLLTDTDPSRNTFQLVTKQLVNVYQPLAEHKDGGGLKQHKKNMSLKMNSDKVESGKQSPANMYYDNDESMRRGNNEKKDSEVCGKHGKHKNSLSIERKSILGTYLSKSNRGNAPAYVSAYGVLFKPKQSISLIGAGSQVVSQ